MADIEQQTLTLQQALDLGMGHHSAGDFPLAESIYQQILQAEPNQPIALHLLGVVAHQMGKNDIAVDLITKALAINPDYAEAHNNLGTALKNLGRLEEAVASHHKAIACKPDFAEAHFNLGNAFKDLGKLDEAIENYRMAVGIKPDYAEAHCNLGNAFKDISKLGDAVGSYQTALAINPDYAEAQSNLGNALQGLGKLDEAVQCYQKALAIKPGFAEAHYNLGNAFRELGRLDEAVAGHRKALAIKPGYLEAHNNLGLALQESGKLDEALASYDTAIAIDPDYGDAYGNKALALLLAGDFENGLHLYEWRWKFGKLSKKARLFAQPLWLGEESLTGKTILLHSEQGLGDTIQFCRYAKLVADLGARVILEVERPLTRMLKQLGGVDEIVAHGGDLPAFDFHCPLMSLPLAFKTRIESIPNPVSYLGTEAHRVNHWANTLGDRGFKIGICWQGGTSNVDIGRSFPLAALREISKIPNVRLINLHKGDGLAQLENLPSDMAVENLGADFDAGANAFLDTAAVMTLCDLVITSDTAIAHLAGALGLPAWLALKKIPDWRWFLDRDDSPWYPSIKLNRQPSAGDWHSVFEDMAADIRVAAR
jgi:tetratricopeptide (TPR) repeat protein